MENKAQNGSLDRYKALSLIFWAIVFSPFVYAIVCELCARYVFIQGKTGFAHMPDDLYNKIRLALYGLSALETVLVGWISMALRAGEVTLPVKIVLGQTLRAEGDDFQVLQQVCITMLALSEAVAIYGVILFLIQGIRIDSYPLIGMGVVLMLLFKPDEAMMERVKAIRGKIKV